MDWNGGSNLRMFGNRPPDASFNLFYDQYYSGMEGKSSTETHRGTSTERKKRLTNEQLEWLERSFQEEVKLEPDRKMKLSRELGIEPRQIAVWFQNRRARWKTKQLERLYDALKQQFDAISTEKLRLQQEVEKLKSMLQIEQGSEGTMKKQGMTSTNVSREETVESSSNSMMEPTSVMAGCSYMFNVEDYTNPQPVSVPYWSNGAVGVSVTVPLLPPSFP